MVYTIQGRLTIEEHLHINTKFGSHKDEKLANTIAVSAMEMGISFSERSLKKTHRSREDNLGKIATIKWPFPSSYRGRENSPINIDENITLRVKFLSRGMNDDIGILSFIFYIYCRW